MSSYIPSVSDSLCDLFTKIHRLESKVSTQEKLLEEHFKRIIALEWEKKINGQKS